MKKILLISMLLTTTLSGVVSADDAAIQQSLSRLDLKSTDIAPSPIAGVKTVFTDDGVMYVTDDGQYIIHGPLYDVSGKQPINITNALLMTKLNALETEMIIYKAPQERYVVTVFTDITCGYCRKLHEEMNDYNALGITVRYLAFPRQGLQSQAKQEMNAIWCASDRHKAFNDAMAGKSVPAASCDIDIGKHYAFGVQFGINGTPAIVLSNGTMLPGYQPPKALKAMLDAYQKQTTGQ
ncbi:bifunctional protein-disulfide isomerase/oxidoreductase DsbC [Enterobacteriaceae bacterium ESL0689]|nr:bifunctional protein-disulfide isomerase/oxidoreductase DsbC [Enterobacteriaceae bacterium ESL0689]